MLLIYSGSVDVEMNTLKMPNFKPDTASGKTSSYTLLQPSLHDPSSAAFKNKTFHSLSGLQYIQPYINEIIARNDSDTSTGVELDPLEDLLRFNLHNSLQVVAIETSQQVNSYSTNITRFAAWCAYLLQFAPLAIMLLTMLAATGIVGLFNLKLKKRLVKTLQFKVDDDDRRNKSWTNA